LGGSGKNAVSGAHAIFIMEKNCPILRFRIFPNARNPITKLITSGVFSAGDTRPTIWRSSTAGSASRFLSAWLKKKDTGDDLGISSKAWRRPSLKTMVNVAIREPEPLIRWALKRTVAKVDPFDRVGSAQMRPCLPH
jgi:hypothetical protein